MAQKTVFIADIGEVVLSKRRGSTNLRISINGAGKVRVGMPYWTPYAAGIAFAKSRAAWIKKHMVYHEVSLLKDGDLIGKSHRLRFVKDPSIGKTMTRITQNTILVTSPFIFTYPEVQKKATLASERALNKEASHLLPQRLEVLAKKHDFSYSSVKVRKLISRWGSCSSKKNITLSYYLMQLPWQLIDYVLLHELVHTKHLNHSSGFWSEFEKALPKVRALRKEIKHYKPKIKPYEP